MIRGSAPCHVLRVDPRVQDTDDEAPCPDHVHGGLRSLLDEVEEVLFELLLVGSLEAVRRSGIDLQAGVFQQRCGLGGGRPDRNDLVVLTMRHEDGNVDLLSIFFRSSVKSVSENASMQSRAPLTPACIDRRQKA